MFVESLKSASIKEVVIGSKLLVTTSLRFYGGVLKIS